MRPKRHRKIFRSRKVLRAPQIYCGFDAGGGCAGGVCPAGGFVVDGLAGFFFRTAGFFGGSVSSTTIFFGGAAGIAACAVFKSARSRTIFCLPKYQGSSRVQPGLTCSPNSGQMRI